MDEQKDIQKHDALSRFFDTRPLKTNPFGNNQSAERLYRRAERVVGATFLLTNHIHPQEPLRGEVRRAAVSILDAVFALKDELRVADSMEVSSCKTAIRRTISLVRLLTVSAFVSVQNASVLIEALDEVGNFISTVQASPLSEDVQLTRNDFIDGTPHVVKDIKDRNKSAVSFIKDTASASNTTTFRRGIESRKQSILNVLQGAPGSGIKDILAHLPEYSEKMIQRDLSDLVVEGRVTKAGEKRWSRYSLASS